MTRLLALAALVAAAVLTVAVMSGGAGTGGGKRVHVVEHATTDATTDTGDPGDTAGDILTFANDVFNEANTTKVGHDQGYCIRINAPGSYECNWTTFLETGSITVEGPFFDTADSTLAITGGTGTYRNSRGYMRLKAREGGTEFDFVFHLIG
jgi:Allene oxide cyclase